MSFTAVGKNNQTVWGAQTKKYTGSDRVALGDYTNSDSLLVYNTDKLPTAGISSAKYIGDTGLLSGVSYFIENVNSGLLMEVKNGLTDEGTNIQQWEMNKGPHHEWRITDLGNGYCKIALMSDETMALTVDGTGSDDGLNIILSKYSGADNQQWKLIKNGSSYGIVSKSSGDTAGLDVYEWSTKNGGNINQWNFWGGECQLWKIKPVYPAVTEGSYTLRNVNSGKFISTNGTNVVQNKTADVWKLTAYRDGTFVLTDKNGKALTVENGTDADGNNISVSENKGTDSQKFKIICNKDGSYSLLSAVSDGKSCVDVYEISMDDGANICQWNFWGGDGQKFVLEPTAAASADKIKGDANADGKFNIADLVMTQKYILRSGILTDPDAADVCEDSKIDAFDLAVMRKMLISGTAQIPSETLKIYAVGDSITYGHLTPEDAYPLTLETLMTQNGYNLADGKIINYGGNAREIDEFEKNIPGADIVLLMGGTNDVHQGDGIRSSDHDTVYNSIKTDMTQLIAELRKSSGKDPKIFLATIPCFKLYEVNSDGKTGTVTVGGNWWWNLAYHDIQGYASNDLSKLREWESDCNAIIDAANEAIKDIAKSDSSITLVDIYSVITPDLLQEDGCHPNKDGWVKIAETFYKSINSYYTFG